MGGDMFQEIRDPKTGHLVGKIDSKRLILEVKRKGELIKVDLTPYLQGLEQLPEVQQAK